MVMNTVRATIMKPVPINWALNGLQPSALKEAA
jgi:hypothetical protein